MRKLLIAAAAIAGLSAGAAHAATMSISDPVGDFVPNYLTQHPGTPAASLDITGFTVDFTDPFATFLLDATFVGNFQDGLPGDLVLGINTGSASNPVFAGIGQPNILFNQAVVIHKDGSAKLGTVDLTATITGNDVRLAIPTALLPSTGFDGAHFGFSLWTRDGSGGINSIADFAPNNRTLSAAPEPTAWALMIGGFGLAGATLRGRRKSAAARLA